MRKIGAYEAKTHLAALLNAVANGETVVITRRGRPIARIVPAATADRGNTARVISRMKAARDARAPMTRDEIIEARDAGRRR
jgi:prevent-host-death family protein